jgi:hypothetical protein
MSKPAKHYIPQFYSDPKPALEPALQVLPIVLDMLHPASMVMVDVGCDVRNWLLRLSSGLLMFLE